MSQIISDADMAVLISRYFDLEFEDDVSGYKCSHCDKVALSPCFSDCCHLYCGRCRLIYGSDAKYKCRKCQQFNININRYDPLFEEKLYELNAHCPNRINGCKTVSMLMEIPDHLKRCKYTYTKELQSLIPSTETASAATPTQLSNSAINTIMDNILNEVHENGQPSETVAVVPVLLHHLQQQQNVSQPSKFDCKQSIEPEDLDTDFDMNLEKPPQRFDTVPGKEYNIFSPKQSIEPEDLGRDFEINFEKQRRQQVVKFEAGKTAGNDSQLAFKQINTQKRATVPKISSQRFGAMPGKEYNIILMGQTGVGKSTFINAFANYLKFNNLRNAEINELTSLIACNFSISDDNYEQQTVTFGSDANENLDGKGESATQSCKAYEFPIDDFILRIIDTPGIGDTRGLKYDHSNVEGILKFLSKYVELHAVCILLKPNESKLTPLFAFCIKQLLSRLHESASKNIVFIFTNSRNTFYRPGDTQIPLRTLLKKINQTPPHPNIPYDKNNIFCLDNESFRFLVALKNGISFSEMDRKNFSESWNKSVDESERMIRYIVEGADGLGLTPHNVCDTLSVNQARDAIFDLAKPIADIAKNIQDNLDVLSRHKREIEDCAGDVNKLQSKLYMPVVTLDVKELDQPRTVCTGEDCREAHQMGSVVTFHYPKKCHDPCYLDEVPKEVVGHDKLMHCWCINGSSGNCSQCGCNYRKHMHVYYESEVVNKNEVDQNIQSQLKSKEGIKKAAEDIVIKMEAQIGKYRMEEKKLRELTAKLAVFLKNSAMVVCNDAIQEYLNEIIENEKSLGKCGANNAEIIHRLQQMLKEYEVEKQILENALKNNSTEVITPEDVYRIIEEISNMNITGIILKKSAIAKINVKQRTPVERLKIKAADFYKKFF